MARDVESFQNLMRLHGAVIGGSAVVQLVWPGFGQVTNYDLFVPTSAASAVIAHLTTVEGYTLDAIDVHHGRNGCMVGDTAYWSGVSSHVTLRRGTSTTIDVLGVGMADEWDRVLLPIARSWATILINFATADKVTITYPTLTLQGKALFRLSHALDASFPGGTSMPEMEKYQARGVQFRTNADDWDDYEDGMPRPCQESWVCPVRPRAFGDEGCLVLGGGESSSELGGVSWTLGGPECPFTCGDSSPRVSEVHIDWCACGVDG